MTLAYRVKLEPDDDGSLLVTCRALPEVTTFGADEADALKHARDAIEEAIAARINAGEDIPSGNVHGPHLVRLEALTSLKVELYLALQNSGVTRAELARRLNWNRESVDRLFRLDHASKLSQIEQAARALKKVVDVHIGEAALP
jgi:antitoxin HicB